MRKRIKKRETVVEPVSVPVQPIPKSRGFQACGHGGVQFDISGTPLPDRKDLWYCWDAHQKQVDLGQPDWPEIKDGRIVEKFTQEDLDMLYAQKELLELGLIGRFFRWISTICNLP